MDELISWLTAQLDHDEQWARAATPGPWTAVAPESPESVDGHTIEAAPNATGYRHKVAGPGYNGGGIWSASDAEHIALNDPGRVLRRVAAHRAILARHKPVAGRDHTVCDIDSHVGIYDDEGLIGDPYPCPDVRALASIYSDRPGFDPSWTAET